MRMNRRRGVQPHGFTDLPHRWWIAGLRRVFADEVEDLLLPLRQIQVHRLSDSSDAGAFLKSAACRGKLPSNTCSQSTAPLRRPQRAPSPCTQTSRIAFPQAAVAELVDAQG